MKPYSAENKKMFFFLLVMAVTCATGFQGWRTIYNNFAVEQVGITGQENGIIQGMREIPGFLSFLVIYVLLFIKEHHLAAVSVLIMGMGVAFTGVLDSFGGLLFSTMVMSFGFHYYETVNQSLTLQHFSSTQTPLVLGRVRSANALANITVGISVIGLSYVLDYSAIFGLLGGLVAVVGLGAYFSNPSPKETTPQQKKFILRSRYKLFYALTFMAGARRQVFVAFAVFLLVQRFSFSLQEIAVLFLINNVINFFVAPMVGKAINRFGERTVLSVEYSMLIIVFLVYAFAQSKAVVAAAYVLDHIFFSCSIAIPSFFRKIADPGEVAPSMAVGFTINHIVAVIIPVIGGLVWMVDYRIPFVGGAVLAGVSLYLARLVPSRENLKPVVTRVK
ncbi:MFS transporter [Dethiosulfatarculus sandiegensis]|uniref:Membrane protein n=1 Tax=Dethiosulfatarculus sandiegensis TaxID=1429043 RepID=A0A0D2J631_9BACT|nr:MFS transporter [Dethiosulfatarculus sandiegensis]KIX11166.1 membrane protein [Dethiosulfatarculus sandiegensis]